MESVSKKASSSRGDKRKGSGTLQEATLSKKPMLQRTKHQPHLPVEPAPPAPAAAEHLHYWRYGEFATHIPRHAALPNARLVLCATSAQLPLTPKGQTPLFGILPEHLEVAEEPPSSDKTFAFKKLYTLIPVKKRYWTRATILDTPKHVKRGYYDFDEDVDDAAMQLVGTDILPNLIFQEWARVHHPAPGLTNWHYQQIGSVALRENKAEWENVFAHLCEIWNSFPYCFESEPSLNQQAAYAVAHYRLGWQWGALEHTRYVRESTHIQSLFGFYSSNWLTLDTLHYYVSQWLLIVKKEPVDS